MKRGHVAVVAAGAVAAAVWLAPLSRAWSASADLGHGWAVPLLMAYLWWERWGERPARAARAPRGAWGWALPALLAVHLLLRLCLTPFPLWPGAVLAYTLVMAGAATAGAWLLAGWPGVRWFAPPLLLLASALPLPSSFVSAIIQPVRETLASAAAEISSIFWLPAIAFGTTVRVGAVDIGIDEACGGIRSLQACAMIGLFFGEWYRFGWRRRGALLFAGVGAALLGNFSRVLFLAWRAGAGAQAVASAHDRAGWIAMLASLVLTGALAWRWGGFRAPAIHRTPGRAAASALVAWPWFAAVALIFAVDEGAARWWYGRAEGRRAAQVQWTVRWPSQLGTFRPTPLDDVSRELLGPDFFTAGQWLAPGDFHVSAYYIEWRRGQAARYIPFLHNPTVCLPLAGCQLIDQEPDMSVAWVGGRIPFHCYRFSQMGGELLVAFTIWDPARAAPLEQNVHATNWRENWRRQWREVREARENQPGQLLSVGIPWRSGSREAMQSLLSQLVHASAGN
jgi:exosortase